MSLEAIEARAQEFLASKKTLMLATVGADGAPTASPAPYVRRGIDFYIYTSGLSRHTYDLKKKPRTSVMVIEDETSAENLFARKRLIFSCRSFEMPRDNEWGKGILRNFRERFGDIFDVIEPLPDFTLFCLEPYEVVYVEGFGRAYRLSTELTNPVHLRGTGPGAEKLETS